MKMRKRWLWLLTVLVVPVGYSGLAVSGNLEPSGTPGSTMRTMEELQPAWSKKITEASKRFELVLDGAAVLDKETGLVWEKNPDTTPRTWDSAVFYAYNKTVGGRKGWRLPTIEELSSLIDTSGSSPQSLPDGHPFGGLQQYYWSSTTHFNDTSIAWYVYLGNGAVTNNLKSATTTNVWCVRGAHGHDGQ